jgi:hypothetical protein
VGATNARFPRLVIEAVWHIGLQTMNRREKKGEEEGETMMYLSRAVVGK